MNRCPVWLALLLTLGCDSPTRDPGTLWVADLTAQLERAEVLTEIGFLDIGIPETRPFLGQGWSWNEEEESGTTFVWGTRHSSEIHFFLAESRPLRLRLRCKPYRKEASSVDSLSIAVNGETLERLLLRRGWQEYDLLLPAESLQSGINRMAFEYHWTRGPVPAERARRRLVGVAWDWIRFPEIDTRQRPSSARDQTLTLTTGSQVDFYFDAPGETTLVIEDLRHTGFDSATLEISALAEGEDEPVLRRIEGSPTPGNESMSLVSELRFPLTAMAGLVRLRFLAGGDFELSRPRILTAAVPDPVPDEHPALSVPPAIPRVRPSLVLLYVIDTLRADHLSSYRYGRDTTPGLALLEMDSVVFEDALAHSSWTKPSTASILTGHLPWSHGAERKEDALSGEVRSLSHYLAEDGYPTAGFSANGNVSEVFGFHHGFDHFSLMGRFDAPATEVQAEALRWLGDRQGTDSAFLYAHTIDPHAPYVSTQRFYSDTAAGATGDRVGTVPFMRELARSRTEAEPALVQELIDLYDEEIAFNDRQLAALIETLKSQGLYDNALILVASDHGEEFYDHGNWTHGRTLHHEVLQVPLMIKFPGSWGAGSRITDTVQQVDILPTILEYLALPRSRELPGSSLLCSVQQTLSKQDLDCETRQPRPVFSSVHYFNNHWMGVTQGDWKLILRGANRLDREAQLFNRRVDPEERVNLADLNPLRVGYLASLIREEMRNRPIDGASRSVELDEETRQRLEALGYLN